MEISKIIQKCIAIIEKEVTLLEAKQQANLTLDPDEGEKVINYVKTLIVIEKDRRNEKDLEFKTDKDLEEAILAEAERIQESRKVAE